MVAVAPDTSPLSAEMSPDVEEMSPEMVAVAPYTSPPDEDILPVVVSVVVITSFASTFPNLLMIVFSSKIGHHAILFTRT